MSAHTLHPIRIRAHSALRTVRRGSAYAFLAVLCVWGLCVAPAAAQSKNVSARGTTQVLPSEKDGYPISITYYEAPDRNAAQENAPVLIMVHGEGGSRLIYDSSSKPPGPNGKPLAEMFNLQGFAVVTVDLRKHGESLEEGASRILKNEDFSLMAYSDLPAVKKFLVQEHEKKKLNINKLGIIAADSMVPVALEFAASDWSLEPHKDGPGGSFGTPRGQDVRAIVMLSPIVSVGPVNGAKSSNFLKDPSFRIAFFVAAGTRDPEDRNAAQRLFQIVSAPRQNEERVELFRPNTNARGTDLLGNPAAQPEQPIHEFLDKHVKRLDSEWRTRKNRYDRDASGQ